MNAAKRGKGTLAVDGMRPELRNDATYIELLLLMFD